MTAAITACRACGGETLRPFLSLGKTPLADALVRPDDIDAAEQRFPLEVAFCEECTLVQILHDVPPQTLFVDNYLYFSSFSDHLLEHSRAHATNLITSRGLGEDSLVVELASNDGYLLKNFAEQGIPVLGIDPAPDQAAVAIENGIPTLVEFFGVEVAQRLRAEGKQADVIIANNVMAHVPDLDSFVGGMAELIADDGLITVENPWVHDLVQHAEFDTIYHEHFSYYSCTSVHNLMRRHGLFLNDVEYFPDLHGGTLRWHCGPVEDVSDRVREFTALEEAEGVTGFAYYADFGERVQANIDALRALLIERRAAGRTIAAYGAAAKGSTLLNASGIGTDLLDFVVDRNVHKHGLMMPGVHVPVRPTEALLEEQPDDVLILAWNFADEIVAQQAEYVRRGGTFLVPVPTPAELQQAVQSPGGSNVGVAAEDTQTEALS